MAGRKVRSLIKNNEVFRLTIRNAINDKRKNEKTIPGSGLVPITEETSPYKGIGFRSKYRENLA